MIVMIVTRGLPFWIADWNVEGRRRRRSNLGGYVVNLEGATGPWQVVQALREQSGISTPIRATLWITPW
jgi:hypothetical protein